MSRITILATVCFCYSNSTWKVKLPWLWIETPTCEPILTSVAPSKFVFVEFSPELMNVIKLYENINVGQTEYKLKGMVRSCNKRFTWAVLIQKKWTYPVYWLPLFRCVKEFSNLTALKKQFKGAFIIYLEGGLWWFPYFFLSFFWSPPLIISGFFSDPPPPQETLIYQRKIS